MENSFNDYWCSLIVNSSDLPYDYLSVIAIVIFVTVRLDCLNMRAYLAVY